MEENTTNTNDASKSDKEKKKSKKNKKNENKKTSGNFFSIYKAEFKKVSWPSRKSLFKETITVIFLSLIVGAIIFGYDTAFGLILNKMIELLK